MNALTEDSRDRLNNMADLIAQERRPETIVAILRTELRVLTKDYDLDEKQAFPQ